MDDQKRINTIIVEHYSMHFQCLPDKIDLSEKLFYQTCIISNEDKKSYRTIYVTNNIDIASSDCMFITYTVNDDEVFQLDNLEKLFYVSDAV